MNTAPGVYQFTNYQPDRFGYCVPERVTAIERTSSEDSTMNAKVLSDLHLEFEKPWSVVDPGKGDVLVLAGDICSAIDLVDDRFQLKSVY